MEGEEILPEFQWPSSLRPSHHEMNCYGLSADELVVSMAEFFEAKSSHGLTGCYWEQFVVSMAEFFEAKSSRTGVLTSHSVTQRFNGRVL